MATQLSGILGKTSGVMDGVNFRVNRAGNQVVYPRYKRDPKTAEQLIIRSRFHELAHIGRQLYRQLLKPYYFNPRSRITAYDRYIGWNVAGYRPDDPFAYLKLSEGPLGVWDGYDGLGGCDADGFWPCWWNEWHQYPQDVLTTDTIRIAVIRYSDKTVFWNSPSTTWFAGKSYVSCPVPDEPEFFLSCTFIVRNPGTRQQIMSFTRCRPIYAYSYQRTVEQKYFWDHIEDIYYTFPH